MAAAQGCCGLSRAEKNREGASHVGATRNDLVLLLVAAGAAVGGWTAGISEGRARILPIFYLLIFGGIGLIILIRDFWKPPV
jgi:hypothetical protein